jgi:Zn-dependent peptidase ImmA (M78 family)
MDLNRSELLAKEIRRKYPRETPEQIAQAEDIQIIFTDYTTDRFSVAVFLDTIVCGKAPPPLRQLTIAHALGHYYLHKKAIWWSGGKEPESKEWAEADCFAAWLLDPASMERYHNRKRTLFYSVATYVGGGHEPQ